MKIEYVTFLWRKVAFCPYLLWKKVVIQNLNYNFVAKIQNSNLKK